MLWPERGRLRTENVLKRCCVAKDVYLGNDNFSREYLVKILSGNVCKRVPCKISNQNGVDIF